jgi:biopolymer transport protein ExbD
MSIHAPGRIRMGAPKMRGLRTLAPLGGRRRGGTSLSMTSMIDEMVVLTVFLLLSFSPSDACGCIERRVVVPRIANGLEMIDAPLVTIGGRQILVDGTPIDADAVFAGHRIARVDGLLSVLRAQRENAKRLRPESAPPSHVVLKIDVDVPAYVVKSVFSTAAAAGYPSIDFVGEAMP